MMLQPGTDFIDSKTHFPLIFNIFYQHLCFNELPWLEATVKNWNRHMYGKEGRGQV